VQAAVGMGSETVRPPRMPLVGDEREAALAIIHDRLGDDATFGSPRLDGRAAASGD
jgi:hypothetical protein